MRKIFPFMASLPFVTSHKPRLALLRTDIKHWESCMRAGFHQPPHPGSNHHKRAWLIIRPTAPHVSTVETDVKCLSLNHDCCRHPIDISLPSPHSDCSPNHGASTLSCDTTPAASAVPGRRGPAAGTGTVSFLPTAGRDRTRSGRRSSRADAPGRRERNRTAAPPGGSPARASPSGGGSFPSSSRISRRRTP